MSIQDVYKFVSEHYRVNSTCVESLENYFTDITREKQEVLIAEECQAMSGGAPLLSYLFSSINFFDEVSESILEEYYRVKILYTKLLESLPFELFNKIHQSRVDKYLGQHHNALSLSINHLVTLYKWSSPELDPVIMKLRDEWLNEVCLPLIHKKCDIDSGIFSYGNTNLLICLKNSRPLRPGDPLTILADKIITLTTCINKSNNYGETPLQTMIRRKFPAEKIIYLIKHGADVNATGCDSENILDGIKSPLLSHCINNHHYEALSILLENGADPNMYPNKKSYVYSSRKILHLLPLINSLWP
jgi:hypothetical protein